MGISIIVHLKKSGVSVCQRAGGKWARSAVSPLLTVNELELWSKMLRKGRKELNLPPLWSLVLDQLEFSLFIPHPSSELTDPKYCLFYNLIILCHHDGWMGQKKHQFPMKRRWNVPVHENCSGILAPLESMCLVIELDVHCTQSSSPVPLLVTSFFPSPPSCSSCTGPSCWARPTANYLPLSESSQKRERERKEGENCFAIWRESLTGWAKLTSISSSSMPRLAFHRMSLPLSGSKNRRIDL